MGSDVSIYFSPHAAAFPHRFSLIFPLCLPLSTSFSVSSLVAAPCWGESNLNYVSQGPIPLLPAVGISGLLISYQTVIGLRSPSPSDIPQIYDTPDSLSGGWGGRAVAGGSSSLPACQHFTQQNVFLTTKMPTVAHVSFLAKGFSTSCQGEIIQSFKLHSQLEVQQDFMLCANYEHPFLPFLIGINSEIVIRVLKWKWCGLPRKKLLYKLRVSTPFAYG